MLPLPPISTLFPYTTLFRSSFRIQMFPSARKLANFLVFPGFCVVAKPGIPGYRGLEMQSIRVLAVDDFARSEEHTSELQSLRHLVCRLLLEKKKMENVWFSH